MPLLDHFHPPLSTTRHWEAFHARWAAAIADALNDTLPEGYFAEAQVHVGPRVEIDIATFDSSSGGTATQTITRPMVTADAVLPMTFPPEYAVNIFETSGGPTLVAAIELVSPANKDRDDARRSFAAKCLTFLARNRGLMVVDVVTNRRSRPFEELWTLLDSTRPAPPTGDLTAVSYRPTQQNNLGAVELRIRTLAVGEALPELPLALDAEQFAMVDLEATYEDARERSRL